MTEPSNTFARSPEIRVNTRCDRPLRARRHVNVPSIIDRAGENDHERPRKSLLLSRCC